ncbi:MAG: hypothetical protein H6705_16895 [Myxococcales bacterium]|nr:hypothetical protein [Myxococcales bacterium]
MAQLIQGGRRVLQGMVSGIANDANGYLVDQLLPATPGPHKGIIKVLTGGDHFGSDVDDTAVAPGAEIPTGNAPIFADVNYTCQKRGRKVHIPDEYKDRSEIPIDIEAAYVGGVVGYLKIMRDKRLIDLIEAASWAYKPIASDATADAGDRWTATTAYPVAQMKTAIDALVMKPNVAVIGVEAFSALSTNVNVLSKMPTVNPSHLADEEYFASAIAAKLGLRKVIVYDMRRSANSDPATLALTRMFSKSVFLACMSQHPGVAAPNNDVLIQPSALARVQEWDFMPESKDDFDHDSTKYKVTHSEDMQVVSVQLGALLAGRVA